MYKMKNRKNWFLIGMIALSACNPGEHTGHKEVSVDSTYSMKIDLSPSSVNTNQPIKYILTPMLDSSVTKLEVLHEKKIHLIVVSDDLGSFKHVHPEEQADGSFTFTDSFRLGGKYLMYADYKPEGGDQMISLKMIEIGGEPKPAESFTAADLEDEVNGYKVILNPDKKELKVGSEMMFTADIYLGTKLISHESLQDYLGEKAHMVIIGLADKKYLHVHPMIMDNKLMFHATFSAPGLYRVWLEFKKQDIVNAADFVIEVRSGDQHAADTTHHH